MKMKSLLSGVILGLFAVVHSTPVHTVTQIPATAEDDVFREAMTDEFLVDQSFFHSLTTEPPKRNTTVQASHQPLSDTEERGTQTPSYDLIESSAAGETSDTSTNSMFFQDRGEHYATTTPTSPSSTSTVLPRDTHDSTSDSSTTQSPQSDFISSSSMPNVDYSFLSTLSSHLGSGDGEILGQNLATSSSMTPTSSNTETTPTSLFTENEGSGMSEEFSSTSVTTISNTETSTASSTFLANTISSEGSESGSGSGSGSESNMSEEFSSSSTTTSSYTETSTTSSPFPAITTSSKGSRSDSDSGSGSSSRMISNVKAEPENPDSTPHKGHSTPDWIIILGFVVGVAALSMFCAAIATRDKWNGSHQLGTKTNSSHQQREVEMETFLHNDVPRENGKAAEYTVIPLDELPEKYSH